MLTLDDRAWQFLNGPYGIDESLPEAIAGLKAAYSKELLDDIIWERIYHQNTLYENTFAAIPHLLEVVVNSTDAEMQLDILCSLAVLISEDYNPPLPDTIPAEYEDNTDLTPEQVHGIYNAYLLALQQLPALCAALLPQARAGAEEDDKTYFLAATAVAHGQHAFARVFIQYSGGEEYIAHCEACGTDTFVWPKGDRLLLFQEDPVFHKEQEALPITPHPDKTPAWDGTTITEANSYAWGYHFLSQLDMPNLKQYWPYLFGTASCPGCGKPLVVFESILAGM
ncbi:hypothetical protein HF324_14090 [Chitinophaga oryzae]|uniref:Uncharacterized protein n=1 Tax=Chitinophaga oryzae TaxID=2725414 RepID=A0ABX6LFY9_9BACT|nr:hypothetical protein [Chitinophaga oryzae]QJB38931.1 hypothetical protein HF324_14090 [Chitinophaga oryzae]